MSFALPATTYPFIWHQVLESLAILAGVQLYRYQAPPGAATSLLDRTQFPIVVGALLGAGIGNKLVFWLERADLWQQYLASPQAWFMGQSMVGGLVGGLLGVEIAKRITGQHASTGDRFVYPILFALCIGRMGCFMAGLPDATYGTPTALPWGVDFGDGIARHPTQLYEIVFAIALWAGLAHARPVLDVVPGLRFKLMLAGYLLWRLLVDGIKPVPFAWAGGLSGIQWVCIIALSFYAWPLIANLRQLQSTMR